MPPPGRPGVVADLPFPVLGVDQSQGFQRQPKLTCIDALNARAFDWGRDRMRGASRPGLSKFCPLKINATAPPDGSSPYSIQDIIQMVTAEADDPTASGQFVYARTPDNGFGLGSAAGASYFTGGAVSGYRFVSSCWDSQGNVYVAEANTINDDESGVTIHKVDGTSPGTLRWTQTNLLVVATGGAGHRKVAGMCVVGDYLYVAATTFSAPVADIYKINRSDGTLASDGNPWVSNNTSGLTSMRFSTAAVNVLAAVGSLLGVVSCGTATDNFFILNTATAAVHASTGAQGTTTNSRSKADSDGAFFYATLASGGKKVCKIKTDGTVVWTWAGAANDTVVCAYDAAGQRLMVLDATAGALYHINPNSGAVVGTTASPGGATTWDSLDCDGTGNTILWSDSVASNDVASLGPALAAAWGPSTFANAVHQGASVFRGSLSDVTTRHRLLVMSGGRLYRVSRETRTAVSGGQAWSASKERIFSAQLEGYVYYADGIAYYRYSGASDAVEIVTASAGSLPADSQGRVATLVERWNGRLVWAGVKGDRHNWYMSEKWDGTNYDYSPSPRTSIEAVAGNNSPLGLIGDVVTSMCSYSDDLLVFGCDHEIWMMAGDPADGGQLLRVSDQIGFAPGRPYCKHPDGTLYFFATRGGVYSMVPGSRKPEPVSQQIARRLRDIDVGANEISMGWDDRAQGLYVHVTPYDEHEDATHYFYDGRNWGWWPVEYAHRKMNPKVTYALDGDDPNDRVIMIGSEDSYVRVIDAEVGEDDGLGFDSFVWIGPILPGDMGEMFLHELQATLADDSGRLEYEVFVGRTAQGAFESDPVAPGFWAAGRTFTTGIGRSGYAIYVRVSASGVHWVLEQIRLRIDGLGPVRRRNA